MQKIYPSKLKPGEEVRVIAPARSLSLISSENRQISNERLESLGLKVSFGAHVEEKDAFISSSIESRVEDLHAAFRDPNVKMVLPVIGGFNSNQLLRYLDWELIKNNPKILAGYSDITALQNAIFAKTGLVTYSGPHYSTFGQKIYFDYTFEYFKKCLFDDQNFEVTPSETWADDAWYLDQENRNPVQNAGPYTINEGEAEGTILGANLCTFNILQGTEYFPGLENSILFLEDDELSTPEIFDRDLQSIIHQPGFLGVRGLVIGRFQRESGMTRELLAEIIRTKKELAKLPVVAEVDFGHTQSMITFPIGGEVRVAAKVGNSKIEITRH